MSEECANRAYPKCDWRYEVNCGDTILGYEAWVAAKVESNTEVIPWDRGQVLSLDNAGSPDSRLFQTKHPETGAQFYALVEGGVSWDSPVLDGIFNLVNVHLTGEVRWGVVKSAHRQDALEAIDYFGLTPTNLLK